MSALAYPSRLERRAQVVDAQFQLELDFASYFDQFSLAEAVRSCFVVRTKARDGSDQLWDLTRAPMGARFSVGAAQSATWVLTQPIAENVSTCIDNVRICACDATSFLRSVRVFISRCDQVGATLNDREKLDVSDADLLQQGHRDRVGPFVFLGEEYSGNSVRNSPKNVANLRDAFVRFQTAGVVVARWQFAALVGLVVFMSHTTGVGLWRLFSLMRSYARLASPSSSVAGDPCWDAPVRLAPTVAADIAQAGRSVDTEHRNATESASPARAHQRRL